MFSEDVGYVIRFGVGENISSATNKLSFKGTLSKQEPFEVTESNGLSVGLLDYYYENLNLIYLANQYVEYTISEPIFKSGYWLVRLTSDFGLKIKNSEWVGFEIAS